MGIRYTVPARRADVGASKHACRRRGERYAGEITWGIVNIALRPL